MQNSHSSTQQTEDAIVPAPVLPLVTAEKAAEQWALFEALKAKLLSDQDYQVICGKRYIKRSGFRKLAVFFGISDRIVKEERLDRDDGSFSWRIEAEAKAPNGRSCVGVGACDSRERKFAHPEHDVFSTSHTRAKSRSISDLVAGGAVSAEEVSPAEETEAPEVTSETPIQTPQAPSQVKPSVPVTKDTLVQEGLRQFPLTDGLKAIGMLNVTDTEASIIPEKPLKSDSSPISSFLIPRVLDPMKAKNGFSYTIVENGQAELAYILITGKLSDQQIKDLQTAARWAFSKAMEKEGQ